MNQPPAPASIRQRVGCPDRLRIYYTTGGTNRVIWLNIHQYSSHRRYGGESLYAIVHVLDASPEPYTSTFRGNYSSHHSVSHLLRTCHRRQLDNLDDAHYGSRPSFSRKSDNGLQPCANPSSSLE